MRPSKRLLPLFLLIPLMSACSSSESQLEAIATQLSEAVNRCVIDVRDKTTRRRRTADPSAEVPSST
jgi:hypothetical protein